MKILKGMAGMWSKEEGGKKKKQENLREFIYFWGFLICSFEMSSNPAIVAAAATLILNVYFELGILLCKALYRN